MLVPGGNVVVAVAASHDAIVHELRNLKGGANGGRGGGRLEEGARQVGRLENLVADGFASVEELFGIGLARPAGGPETILHPQIGLVTHLERVQLCVLEVVDSALGHADDVRLPVVVLVGHVQAKRDGGILGEPVEGLEVAGPNDHGVGGNGALGLRVLVRRPAKLVLGRLPDHVVLRVSTEPDVGGSTGVVCKVLQQLDGELIGGVAAGEGEEIRGLNAKAGVRRTEEVGGAAAGIGLGCERYGVLCDSDGQRQQGRYAGACGERVHGCGVVM